MKRLLLSICLVLFTTPVFAMGNMPTGMLSDPLVGKPAPEFTLSRLKGEASNFTAAREGKKAVIVFWATWCPHCHEELANLNKSMSQIEAKGIKVLLVDVGETKADVAGYFDHNKYTFDSFIDEENALQDPYHLVGVPTVIFVDENGNITSVQHEFPEDYESYFSLPK